MSETVTITLALVEGSPLDLEEQYRRLQLVIAELDLEEVG
jgi:hypothetical protein